MMVVSQHIVSAMRRCSPSASQAAGTAPFPALQMSRMCSSALVGPDLVILAKDQDGFLGKLLCFSPCRLCLCNITSRLPSSQPPSRLSCRLTHSSRGLFPSPELFLPSARKMNQCLALPFNARELLLSCQCRMKEWVAYAPSLLYCPPTLRHLSD